MQGVTQKPGCNRSRYRRMSKFEQQSRGWCQKTVWVRRGKEATKRGGATRAKDESEIDARIGKAEEQQGCVE